jgi:3-deoxy-D-manno-octulosonate 8-phosphate phosphatase (KDO 8-P phosphatase)
LSPCHLPHEERCRPIRLLVLDVDGVLTGGGLIFGPGELELKQFHVRDGAGLAHWHRAGKETVIITGRSAEATLRRAAEVGITKVYQGVSRKAEVLSGVLAERGLAPQAVCYMGDDLADLEAMRACGLAVAPADACAEVRASCHYITTAPGGCGAVREAIALILRCQGLWRA